MKYCLLLFLFLIAFSKPSYGQTGELYLALEKSDRGNHYFLMKNDVIIDSILLTYTNDILIDYKVLSEKKVLFIKKDFAGWCYYNVTKHNGKWERSISSGVLAGGDYIPSAYIKEREKAREYYRSLEYTILEEDKILVSDPKGEYIFDCNTIADRRREYLKKMKQLQKN